LRPRKNHADKNQQRRQPRQIEGQHPRHQRGPHIGPQHNHQRRRQRHQILGDKRGHQHGGGIAALHQRRHANPRAEGERLFLNAATENGTQASAKDAHHAGTDNMGAPHQQGDRGQQV
jgi:hypothetical protein